MFILRRVTKHGKALNFSIGKTYSITYSDEKVEFEETMKAIGAIDENISMIVNPDPDVSHPIPICKTDKGAYIMTESGKTFQRIN